MTMRDLAGRTADRADEALADRERGVLERLAADPETLMPAGTDRATYDRLIAAVAEARERNEDVAQFRARLEAAGTEVVGLAKRLCQLAL